MYLSVIDVKTKEDYKLLLKFENDEVREFDMSKYLHIGKFQELRNKALFDTARVCIDTVEWANGSDIDPESLYNLGKPI